MNFIKIKKEEDNILSQNKKNKEFVDFVFSLTNKFKSFLIVRPEYRHYDIHIDINFDYLLNSKTMKKEIYKNFIENYDDFFSDHDKTKMQTWLDNYNLNQVLPEKENKTKKVNKI